MKNLIRSMILGHLLASSLYGEAQVPKLSSYPSAQAVIFLDFDGHRVEGTSFNYLGPIDCAPASLSTARITEVFNRVAEDYRPFNLNVTTDSTLFLAAPLNRRTRVILTTSYEWYGVAGGVAFTGSFSWPDDNPCFVFTSLHGYRAKDIAEAASHEAGHTLGLYHQSKYDENCYKTSEYNWGVGSGEIGWAPIMGAGYSRNFTLWHNGPNTYGCMSQQNDLDVITHPANGFGYRVDDHGSSFATATVPVFTANSFEMTGVVERNTDDDYFQFIMPSTGRFELDAVPYNVGTGNAGSDLDLQVTLYDQTETVLSTYNPGNLLNSVADTTLNGGIYYLKVEGKGNAYASEYASLGSYSLQARVEPGGGDILPLQDLRLEARWANGDHQLQWSLVADEPVNAQSLEISYDGRVYEPLAEMDAASRYYQYRPVQVVTATYYRIRVDLADGHRYYSNTAVVQKGQLKDRPTLLQNPTRADQIRIDAPEGCSVRIVDLQGRTLQSGWLQTGIQTLVGNGLKPGIYLLQFNRGKQQWTEKLMIQ